MIKTLTLTLLLTILVISSATSQFSINAIAAFNSTSAKVTQFEESSIQPYVGYSVGIAPEYQLTPRLSISLSMLYSLRGYADIAYEYGYRSFDFIPEVGYRVNDFLTLGAGAYVNLLRNQRIIIPDDDVTIVIDFTKPFHTPDFGLTGFAKFNWKSIYLFSRYSFGLTDQSTTQFTDTNGKPINLSVITRSLQLGLGYNFSLQRSEKESN